VPCATDGKIFLPNNTWNIEMDEFTDGDFLRFFFDTGSVEYKVYDIQKKATAIRFKVHRPDQGRTATRQTMSLDFFEKIKATINPWSPSITDYLLRVLWIREAILKMDPVTKDIAFSLVTRAFAQFEARIVSFETLEKGFDLLLQKKCLYLKPEQRKEPDVTFEDSWIEVYPLTEKGKRYAERMVKTKKDILAHIKSKPITSEANIDDCPRLSQTTSVRSVPSVVVDERFVEPIEDSESTEMCYAAKTHTSEPYEATLVEIDPGAKKDMFQTQYEAVLALKYADQVDEWHCISNLKYKGKGWANIARAKLEQDVENKKINSFKQREM
jgi:hypothetical protein